MKISELFEDSKKAKMDAEYDRAIPNARMLPKVDQGYGLYRFSLHMASSPDEAKVSRDGAIGTSPFFVPYTQAELDIINHAGRAGGFGSIKHLTHGPSSETEDVHKTSPMKSVGKKKKRKLRK